MRGLGSVNEINRRFLGDISAQYPNDYERLSRMSLIQDGGGASPRIQRANACSGFSSGDSLWSCGGTPTCIRSRTRVVGIVVGSLAVQPILYWIFSD